MLQQFANSSSKRFKCVLAAVLVLAAGLYIAIAPAVAGVSINLNASRTSGVAPLAVFFNASGSSSTSTGRDFHEMDFRWNFGDGQAGVWKRWNPVKATWGAGDRSKNEASGPVAAHVFERPGSYKVVLQVRDPGGAVARKAVYINVASADQKFYGSKTICFSTSGNYNGCPSGARRITTGSFGQVVAQIAPGRRLLLRRGERWQTSRPAQLSGSGPVTLSAFGSGSRPRVYFGANDHSLTLDGISDWRITDLEFQGNRAKNAALLYGQSRSVNLLFLRNRVVPDSYHNALMFPGNSLDNRNQDLHTGLFFVENELRDLGQSHRTSTYGGYAMFIAARRLGILGNLLDDTLHGAHVVRLQHAEQATISHNYIANQSSSAALLAVRSRDMRGGCSAGCGTPTRQIIIGDNQFYSWDNSSLVMVKSNKPTVEKAAGRDLIVERNYFSRSPKRAYQTQEAVTITSETVGVTVRNNIVMMDRWQAYRALVNDGSSVWIYNNTCHSPTSTSMVVQCVRLRSGGNLRAANNLQYAPNAPKSKVVLKDVSAQLQNNIDTAGNPFTTSTLNRPEAYVLRAGHAAVNGGTRVPVYDDFEEFVRPVDGGYDVGASERSGASQPKLAAISTSDSSSTTTTSGSGSDGNRAPVASAGGGQTVTDADNSGAELVTLNGSGSYDPDGQIVSYEWRKGTTLLAKVTSSTTKVSLPVGDHQIGLTVIDNAGAKGNATTTVGVVRASSTQSGGSLPTPLAHWRLNESGGMTASDVYNRYPGRLVNGPLWRAGKVGNALAFDGSNDYVDLGSANVSGQALTLAMWIKADDFGVADARLISKASGVQEYQHYWMLSTFNNGALRFRLKTNGSTKTLVSSNGVIQPGRWHHVAVVYDGSNMRIYRDGSQVAATGKSGSINTHSGVAAAIGNQPGGAGKRPFDGLIDDVRLYNVALSPAQLNALR